MNCIKKLIKIIKDYDSFKPTCTLMEFKKLIIGHNNGDKNTLCISYL